MSIARLLIAGFGTALLVAATWLTLAYRADMQRAYAAIDGRSELLPSPYGDIEYLRGGSGSPVLVIHGSGGGFDQGELIASAILGHGFDWIAPSRFGYLRSTFHPGATFDEQAHAYAWLLDQFGIERVAVVALSHGGPSALLFAVLHPERVSSLVLLSAGVAAGDGAGQAEADRRGDRLVTVYRHDPLYWFASRFLRSPLIDLFGAGSVALDDLGPAQRELIDRIIDGMNPVAPRAAGVAFDNRAAMPNERIAAIRVPTLVVHARDDGLQLYRNAEAALRQIPGATGLVYDHGGHLVVAVELEAIRDAVQRHVSGRP